MAQSVVPVYTIPNTYRVQQSLWESLCLIIPGIARTSGSELHSFQPTTPRDVPVGHSNMVPGAGSSVGLGTGAVGLEGPQNVAVTLSTREKDVTQGIRSAGLPDGIPPAGSKWALFPPHVPTVNLADDGTPPDANLPETSTPMKTTPESGKRHSKKKLNLSKIEATHLIFDMRDQQEKARKSVESEGQATVPDQTSSEVLGSGGGLPHGLPATLPDWPEKSKMPSVSKDSTLEAPKWDNKRPHDDDDITEVPDEDKPAEPPKKKKKNKDSKEAASSQKDGDDGAGPSTSMVEPENVGDEATPVPTSTEVPAEETKTLKKKKKQKKDAELKKFRLEQREAKAKEMSKIKHRKLQREQGFRGIRNYRKSIPGTLLESINGADHQAYLVERFQKQDNYMSKKSGHKRNLMAVELLLTRIAKYANEPTKRLKGGSADH